MMRDRSLDEGILTCCTAVHMVRIGWCRRNIDRPNYEILEFCVISPRQVQNRLVVPCDNMYTVPMIASIQQVETVAAPADLRGKVYPKAAIDTT